MRKRIRRASLLALGALIATASFGATADAAKKPDSVKVKVMTRNIFLGADLSDALNSNNAEQFIKANGAILREVDETNFPLRAQGLAAEIASKKPDLLGLQEVAWWRTGATPGAPHQSSVDPQSAFTATTNKYDFLALFQAELEARGLNYKVAVVKEEFDFEAPTDYDNDPNTGIAGGEIQGRLTMRDVILVNEDSKVKAKLKNPQTGTYANLFTPTISGIQVPVTRGWTAGDVTVQKGKGKDVLKRKFRFVNTHFEAFDDEKEHPSIRAKQAQELLDGPASNPKSIILGDFNSDDDTVQPDDQQAYQTLVTGGFTERSTADPLSCCVNNLFTSPPQQFDHQVDHIMSNQSAAKVKLVNSSVTGLEQVNGIYDSDHAGVFSTLKLK